MKKFILSFIASVLSIATIAQIMTPGHKLRLAESVIENYYVDSVNADHVVEEAIKAMIATLDPHSSYTTPEETKKLTEPLDGNFSGIGIQFNMLQDTLYVLQVIAGGPSERVGLRPGDRIISANDTAISGVKMENTGIQKHLRGPKGTIVDIKVLRRNVPDTLNFRIIRDDIPIYSIDAAYMADPTTGYIRISRFAAETPEEFTKALAKLRKQGLKNLIIDLEDNGGGYLEAAQLLVSNFLDKGDLLVYTEAPRLPRQSYYAQSRGNFRDGRVVVMVNQYSASASEIFAGAIQDHDRGLIVGRRTFGKGLVQRPFPFPDGSMIRLTVSRYYTPSGRCIQKPYEEGHSDDYAKDLMTRYDSGEFTTANFHFADSLAYKTLQNGRTVYGGGGIMPDCFVPIDTTFYSNYYRDLISKNVLNQFCINYVDTHRDSLKSQYKTEEAFIEGFSVSDPLMQELIDFGEKEGVKYNEDQYNTSKTTLQTIVKAVIARDLFESGTYFRVANDLNPIYREALSLINSPDKYTRMLSGDNK